MQFLASYVMRGRMQAILVITVTALLSLIFFPLSYLSSAAVALVALRNGYRSCVEVMVGATVATSLLSLLLVGSLTTGAGFVLVLWLPVALLALHLGFTANMAMNLLRAALAAAAVVVAFYLLLDDPVFWWRDLLLGILNEIADNGHAELSALLLPGLDDLASVMSGLVAVAALMQWLCGLYLARWWQAELYNPGGFGRDFRQLRLGRPMIAATLLLLLLAMVEMTTLSQIAEELLLVAVAVVTLQGLAVVHGVAFNLEANRFWLAGLYLLLIFALPQMVIVLAMFGVVDNWFDFRLFWQGKGRKEGEL
ncbi:MAG: DUF2232 domain-containing protein [Gammaproteobacteria bacterium]|nr:DUF2232 domain-containing protein [Gammaproteobacteria bacterium]